MRPPLQLVSDPSTVARSDEDLMVATAAGSREAFAILVSRYTPRTASFCARVTGDRRAGEEIAQDVLLAIWQARHGYRPDRPFRVFLFTIARNRCRNHARSWRRRLRWLGIAAGPKPLDTITAPTLGQVDEVLAAERQQAVRDALATLSERDREVVLLRFEQDLSFAEIAAISGRAEVTVRVRVFHALEKLERALDRGDA
jgi:RNA polymerase sigma-70 factor (ECF subfamily)